MRAGRGHWIRVLAPILLGLLLWWQTPPVGVTQQAWHLLVVFVSTIVGIIAAPLPMGAVALLGVVASVVTHTLTIEQALSGFGNKVIWLIVTSFMIARGFIKTGLSSRIAYLFVSRVGKSTLGLSYGLLATDLVLAPAIPSNTARAGGVIYPIALSLRDIYKDKDSDDSVGAFILKTAFQGNLVTSAMFLTAMAANPLAAQLARDLGVEISWTTWAVGAALPGLVSLVLVPLLLYKLCPPAITKTPDAAEMARQKLKDMGAMTRVEKIMLVVFCLMLGLWMFGKQLAFHSTTTALIGLSLLLVTGVLTWQDVCQEKEAWNTLVWFAALVMMASFLNKLGFIPWFSETMGRQLGGFHWFPAFIGLTLIYFYSHYLFASNTAHVSSMYAPFLGVAIAVGAPPLMSALVLGYFSNLFSGCTHYGCGAAPIFFGAGFLPTGRWWRVGWVVSVVNVVIWLGVGGLWWRLLGYW